MLTGDKTGSKKEVNYEVNYPPDKPKLESTIQLIYELAIGQHESTGGYKLNAAKIAKVLGKSKPYISKVIKKLIKQGYLTCDNPRDKVKFYSPTKKSPKIIKKRLTKKAKNVTGSTPNKLTNFTGGSAGRVFSTSKSQWSCPVSYINEKDLKGWKKTRMANGVNKYIKEYLFTDPFPTILHFQVMGKKNYTMTLTIPSVEFEDKEDFIGAKDQIQDYAAGAMKFISKKYHMAMDLRLLRLSSCDFEARLRDADIKNFIDTAQVIIKYHKGDRYVGTISFDGSGGIDKIESDVPQWVVDYVELPTFSQRLNQLEKKVPELIAEIIDKSMEKGMQKIETGIEQRIDNLFNVVQKPDEKRDVT